MATVEMKNVSDLRVVDLRAELEKRDLDKNGVKAVLLERFQKALESEGKDPNNIEMAITDSPSAKKVPGNFKRTQKSKDMEDGEKDLNDTDKEKMNEDEDFSETADEITELLGDDGEDEDLIDIDNAEDILKEAAEKDEIEENEDLILVEALESDKASDTPVQEENFNLAATTEVDKKMDETKTEKNPSVAADTKENQEESMETDTPVEVKAVNAEEIAQHSSNSSTEVENKTNMESTETKAKPDQDLVESAEGDVEMKDPAKTEVQLVESRIDPKENDVEQEKVDETPDAKKVVQNDTQAAAQLKADVSVKTEQPAKEGISASGKSLSTEAGKAQVDTKKSVDDNKGETPKTDGDSEQLEVLVDDTQNDLDADLKSEAGDGTTANGEGEAKVSEKESAPENGVKEDIPEASSKPSDPDTKPEDKKDGDDKSKSSTSKDTKRDEKSGSRNLWVSSLSSTTRATDLKALFSKYGKVVGAKVVTNARKPGSRCYGFVTMSSADEAAKCIQQLHRTELHGKMISVEKAKSEPGTASKAAPGAKKPDPKPSTDKDKKPTPSKKDEGKPDADKKDDKDKKDVEKKDDKKDDRKDTHRSHSSHRDRHDRGRDRGSRYRGRHDHHRHHDSHRTPAHRRRDDRKTSEKDDKNKPRTVVMDKSKGEPVISVKAEDKEKKGDVPETKPEAGAEVKTETVEGDSKPTEAAVETKTETEETKGSEAETPKTENQKTDEKKDTKDTPSRSRSRATSSKKDDKKDVLSLDKIKEEREKERIRQMERRVRDDERRRQRNLMRERQRQRDVHLKQRQEAIKLARERDRLKREREMLEKERIEAQRLERLRLEQIERERLEREREDKRRLEQLRIQEEQQRRAVKRSYDQRDGRDQYWDVKRPALAERGYQDRIDRNRDVDRGGRDTGRYVERVNQSDNLGDTRRVVDRFDRRAETSGRAGARFDERRDRNVGHKDDRDLRYDNFNDRNTVSGRDRGNDRLTARNDRAGRGDDRRDVASSNYRDNQDSRADRTGNRGHADRGGRQTLGSTRDGAHGRDFRSDRDQAVIGRSDHRDSRSSQDIRGSGGSISQSNRGDNWQGPGRGGGTQTLSERGRDAGGKNFTRGQGSGQQVGSSGQQNWGSGTSQRNEATSTGRADRWTGNSIVQPDARPLAYQTVGAPPGIIANVPTGMYVTTSMAPGALMMAAPNLGAQARQQDQRFDAYKNLGAGLRRY